MPLAYVTARLATSTTLRADLQRLACELRELAFQGEDVFTPFEKRYVGRALNAVTIALHPGCYAGSNPNFMCTQTEEE